MDIHPYRSAFFSVMRQEQDYVLFDYLASIKRNANRGELIDEGVAWEYANLMNILEDERGVSPQVIKEVLDATAPLPGRDHQRLFEKILNESRSMKEKE